MSGRRDEVFHVLKVIRGIVDETREAIDAAIEDPAGDRAVADALRDGCLGQGEGIGGPRVRRSNIQARASVVSGVVETVETIVTSVRQAHAIMQLLISEREELGQALERIRRALDQAGIVSRSRNLGPGARGH